jgi:hypothetical protein
MNKPHPFTLPPGLGNETYDLLRNSSIPSIAAAAKKRRPRPEDHPQPSARLLPKPANPRIWEDEIEEARRWH